MLMEALEQHWRTDVYHETDTRAFEQYQMRDLTIIRSLVLRSRASHIVVKALCEAQHIRELLDTFPNARAIWALRNYHDVSDSMARQFSSTAKALKQMRVDPALGGWRGERLSPSVRSLLQDYIHDDISEISAAAFQWYMRNQLYFDQELERDRRVRVLLYEDLVTKPETTFEAVAGFLGLDFRRSMVANFHASSVNKADRATIDPRIDTLCSQLFSRLVVHAQTQS